MPPLPIKMGGLGNRTGDASGLSVTATGGTTARKQADIALDVTNVRNWGAKGDGATDDAAAINAAILYARGRLSNSTAIVRIVFPQGNYVVQSAPINLTGIQSRALLIEGGGSVITVKTAGKAGIDALGARWMRVRDLTIIGDQTAVPTIGMQIGRIDGTANNSADNHSFENVFIDGAFSFASFYNLNAETTKFDRCLFWNNYQGGSSLTTFAYVADGLNHWQVPSQYVTQKQVANTPQSFNENLFLSCDFRMYGPGTPIWSAMTSRHRYVAGYVANTSGPYGMALYSYANTDVNQYLDLDIHFETTALTDVFLITGPNAAPVFPAFRFRDQQPFASNSVFKLDAGITSAKLIGAELEIGSPMSSKIFDAPAAWTVSGIVFIGSATAWNLPVASFVGMLNQAGVIAGGGAIQGIGSGLALNNGILSWTVPNPLNVASIVTQGGVSGLNISSYGSFRLPNGGTTFPLLTIGAPPAGGTQATAAVQSMALNGFDSFNGGTGFSTGDVLTTVGGSGTAYQLRVNSVDGAGKVTGVQGYRQGVYTSVPAEPVAFTGGTGTGFTATSGGYGLGAAAVTAAGGGYTAAPPVTLSTPAGVTAYGAAASLTSTINNNFSVTAGLGALALDATGTKIGTASAPAQAVGDFVTGAALRISASTGITAAGTTQSGATALSSDLNDVTSVASGAGVRLAAFVSGGGRRQEVWNSGANALLVYPPSGAAIGTGSANAAVSLAAGARATFVGFSATVFRQAP